MYCTMCEQKDRLLVSWKAIWKTKKKIRNETTKTRKDYKMFLHHVRLRTRHRSTPTPALMPNIVAPDNHMPQQHPSHRRSGRNAGRRTWPRAVGPPVAVPAPGERGTRPSAATRVTASAAQLPWPQYPGHGPQRRRRRQRRW